MKIRNIKSLTIAFAFFIITVLSYINAFYLSYFSPDYEIYQSYYEQTIRFYNFSNQRFEPLYYLLSFFSSQIISIDFQYFIFIVSFITFTIKLYSVHKLNERHLLYFILLYILVSYTIFDIISLRANIAVSFLLLSIVFFIGKKKLYFIIFLFISIGFHYSVALVYVPLLAIIKLVKLDLVQLIVYSLVFYLVGHVISTEIIDIILAFNLNTLIENYTSESAKAASLLSVNSISIFLLYFFSMFIIKLTNKNSKYIFLISLFIFLFSLSAISIPVIYFRYIDMALLFFIVFIVSINNYSFFAKRYYFLILYTVAFSIYKFSSLYYFSKILNL